MATTLPVPIEFSLPDGWISAPPDEVGASEAAFVALHQASSDGFTANITISGEIRTDDVPLSQVADEVVQRLEAALGRNVEVGRRNETDSGFSQLVRMDVPMQTGPRDVVQFQVFLGLRDTTVEDRRAVVQIVLSATPEQFEVVVDDYQQFLKTIRLDEKAAR
jgi:hypothetical protein